MRPLAQAIASRLLPVKSLHRDDDHEEAERKRQTAHETRDGETETCVAHDQREHQRAEADEGTSQHAEKQLREQRQPRLGDANITHPRRDFTR